MKFNVNSDAVIAHTNKLEGLTRSAFPNAVRNTLNGLAFDLKKDTMPKSASRFTKRQKNFFKANSTVQMAKGFNVSTMESKMGFMAKGKTAKGAVNNLDEQEEGGTITQREYIPVEKSRIGKSKKRMVQKKNRLNKIGIKNIVKASSFSGSTSWQFMQAVNKAQKGGFVQAKLKNKDVTMVWRVNESMSTNLKTKRVIFKLTPVYIVNKSKIVKVKATHFMEKATKKTMQRADKIYISSANFQYKKHFNK